MTDIQEVMMDYFHGLGFDFQFSTPYGDVVMRLFFKYVTVRLGCNGLMMRNYNIAHNELRCEYVDPALFDKIRQYIPGRCYELGKR